NGGIWFWRCLLSRLFGRLSGSQRKAKEEETDSNYLLHMRGLRGSLEIGFRCLSSAKVYSKRAAVSTQQSALSPGTFFSEPLRRNQSNVNGPIHEVGSYHISLD